MGGGRIRRSRGSTTQSGRLPLPSTVLSSLPSSLQDACIPPACLLPPAVLAILNDDDHSPPRPSYSSHARHHRASRPSRLSIPSGGMVGIFGRSSKSPSTRPTRSSTDATHPAASPPPPYTGRDSTHDHAVFTTETTTTTHVVTTTTQTTHFFSLPLFRRRAHMDSPDALRRANVAETHPPSDEYGVLDSSQNPVVLFRDKELPPTPALSDDTSPRRKRVTRPETTAVNSLSNSHVSNGTSFESSASGSSLQASLSNTLPPSSSCSDLSTHPTMTLARAALGLGLQPVMLNTESPASSSSDLNAASIVPSGSSVTPPLSRSSTSVMRRVKSFHKDKEAIPSPAPPIAETRERRRTRGLSLGPLFSTEGKGKERQHVPDEPETPPVPKTLSRKPSFWSRMRKDSQHTPSPLSLPLPQERSLNPSLPNLQPVSPFDVDQPSASPVPGHSRQPSDLRRRHSERGPVSPKSNEFGSPDSARSDAPGTGTKPAPAPRRRPRRPQTADAAEMVRSASSFYPASPLPPVPSTPISRSIAGGTRPRSQTNPPLLHRLSLNLFGSSPANSPIVNNQSDIYLVESPPSSQPGSARASLSVPGSRPSPRPSVEIPKPRHSEESPEVYLHRLMEAVSKAEVANVLASSADEFHTRALRAYIARFDFTPDPLDVALRRLLMDVGLPRETQQIDRVMEAFAARYVQCHPNLFTSDDHPYVLAFSLIMLHTDAFNKSNKRKMTKPDYVKNTRLPGVPPEVLDCFYDNIVFAPFIFIEDPLDVNGQRGLAPPDATPRRLSTYTAHSPGGLNNTGSTLLGKSNKIDPYFLITHDLLDELRVQVQSYVPMQSPYVYRGTSDAWDEDELLRAFALASVIEVRAPDTVYPAPWFSLGVSGGPGPMSIGGGMPSAYPPGPDAFSLKVTKVGLLMRKDDTLEGGRRAINRKWKEWSVLLTGSQLLLSRDPAWAALIQGRADQANGELSIPQSLIPKPDELVSVKDAVAVFDRSYTKYRNALRLVLPDGRHILLKAADEAEMNSWIARINYASAFKTAGVRMRSLGMSGRDIELTGQAAAASHLRDMQFRHRTPSPRVLTWGERSSVDIDISNRRSVVFAKGQISPSLSSTSSRLRAGSVDSGDDPASPSIDHSARILKATFDQVKEELASGHWRTDSSSTRSGVRPRALSLESSIGVPVMTRREDPPRISSRSKILQSKVHDLQSKIMVAQKQLDADMRFVRNIVVLTPFQRATRERLLLSVQNVSKRVMQVRLDLEKLVCHRDVLSRDLLAEERDWQRTKKIALRAATAKLRSQEQEHETPRMTLSVYMDESERNRSGSTSASVSPVVSTSGVFAESPSHQAASSTSESFHSAMDVSLEWPLSSSSSVGGAPGSDPAPAEGRASSSTNSYVDSPERSRASTLTAERSFESTSSAGAGRRHPHHHHEKYFTAVETSEEQAEEWDKTRAAKRVSLVRLPSDLRMSVLFGKHVRSQSISEDPSSPVQGPASPQSSRSSTTFGSSVTTSPYTRTNTSDIVAMLDV
ncbi:hypothetical protein EIP91_005597 [Steccherinum ochraceum]|uniref:SEC7 domain-containing protein n=1 Tax=Steccherinum ochraceum TaxID=92696 RepID=A0A4R0RFF0_9APHY|nr:hypothetical protein EIP91_005597 [Steccherinum ochraceum]